MSATRTEKEQYTSYIIRCRKVPQARRDLFRSLSKRETYKEVSPATRTPAQVGVEVEYRVELTPAELDRVGTASNLVRIDEDVPVYNEIDSTVIAPEDVTFQNAGNYSAQGWFGGGIDVGVVDTGLGAGIVSKFNVKASRSEVGGSALTDSDGHGSRTASLAVPSGARIVVGKYKASGAGSVSDMAASLNWMVNEVGVDVVNISQGALSPMPAMETAINNAKSKGVIVIASAGNDGLDTDNHYPSKYASLSVGAVDRATGQRWSGSNYGPNVDLYCSGVDIKSYHADGSTNLSTGTSDSAAIATWLWACQHGAVKKDLDSEDTQDSMEQNTDPLNDSGGTPFGSGDGGGGGGIANGLASSEALPGYC